jgi:hypothetical protein
MDYSKVLRRAWEITWRWKVLWILGFLAGLGKAAGTSSNTSYSTSSGDWGGSPAFEIPPALIGVLIGVGCLALLIGIAIWVISVMARGGLIAGVQQVEEESDTSFLRAWRVGRDRFWTLFGIGVLAAIPMIILVILGLLTLGIGVFAAIQAPGDVSWPSRSGGILIPLLCCSGTFCCGLFGISIILAQIRIYAERAAILEGLGWIDSFKRGWDVLKDNLGPTIILWLIFFFIGLALALLVFAIGVALFLPFVAIVANTDPGAWMIAPACCGGLLAVIVFALISAIVETFASATWTLAYRELTGLASPPAAELVTE